eukprot:gene364-3720_t
MSSNGTHNYVEQYRAITAKLKKKFLRRPNKSEVRDAYRDLRISLTKESNYPFAAFVCLAQARCEQAMEDHSAEAETLWHAGQFFFKNEAEKSTMSRNSFEEDVMDGLACYEAAIKVYLQEGNRTLAASLCNEAGSSLAILGKEEEAISYILRAADLELDSPLFLIMCLQNVSKYQIRLARYDDALDSLFRVVDVVLTTCHENIEKDDVESKKPASSIKTSSQLPSDCFLRAARICPPGIYRATVADAEVQSIFLYYLIPIKNRERLPALQFLIQRYSCIYQAPVIVHLSRPLVFLLRSLVVFLESETQYHYTRDAQSLLKLQTRLWQLLTSEQNELLHRLISLRLES